LGTVLVKALRDMINNHLEGEEGELFKGAKKILPTDGAIKIAILFEKEKKK
jgi:hypothetical protein